MVFVPGTDNWEAGNVAAFDGNLYSILNWLPTFIISNGELKKHTFPQPFPVMLKVGCRSSGQGYFQTVQGLSPCITWLWLPSGSVDNTIQNYATSWVIVIDCPASLH